MSGKNAPPADVVAAAKKLLAAGKADDAQNLLLDEGYVKRSDPTIQKAYLQLIPISPTLQEMLDEVYDDLDDPIAKVRFDAATRLSREFSKELLRNNVRWMRDPRASEPLIAAVSDPDRKVAGRALIALSRLVCKYFPDQRALPKVVPKLADTKQDTRRTAISVVGCLRNEEALNHLTDLFERGSDEDRTEVARQVAGLALEVWEQMHQHPISWTKAGRKFWIDKMITGLDDPHAEVRKQAAVALKHFGDPKALPALQSARRGERDENVQFFMDDAIAALKQGS